jgi:hypothetical protein
MSRTNFSKSGNEEVAAIIATINGSNGNGKAKETVVVEEAVAEVVKPEAAPVIVPEVKAPPVISVERRIEKVEELKITIRKYQQLQEARIGLTTFRLGSDGMTATLTLKDADGTPY